ncbi:slit homolog 3 protein-like [Mytilus trossulus]|uniref:slit homolog 3 protein-like n=1 Tax=Mytilus trossulus TaxID=6551 RepID=UPI003004AC58
MANIGILIAMVSFLPETYAQICTVPELSQCICLHGGTEVDCRGIGLTEIPRNIPNTTKALYLDRNAITIIDSASLFGLTSLELLSLTGNTITSIETGAFDWLWSLTYLSLQGDTELDIPGEVLTAINSFTNLSSLSLINCRISSEDINLLSGLQSLKTLSLPNNDISYIKAGFFNGFSSLVNLQLWGNNLTTVSANIFNTTTNISLLVLADNPLLCCTMTDFFEWRPNQPKLRNLYGTCNDFNRTTDINLFNTSHCTFPVDGQWGSWSTPTCSVTCGVGTGLRNRSCDSPPPSDNGKECVGPNMEAINCSLEVCPGIYCQYNLSIASPF